LFLVKNMFQHIYADTIKQAINDLDGLVYKFPVQRKTKTVSVAWWDYLSNQFNGWRRQIYSTGGRDIACRLIVPTLREAVNLWLSDTILSFNTKISDKTLNVAQRKINSQIANYLDGVYLNGDCFLNALNLTANPEIIASLAFFAGSNSIAAGDVAKSIAKKAEPLVSEVTKRLERPAFIEDFNVSRNPAFLEIKQIQQKEKEAAVKERESARKLAVIERERNVKQAKRARLKKAKAKQIETTKKANLKTQQLAGKTKLLQNAFSLNKMEVFS